MFSQEFCYWLQGYFELSVAQKDSLRPELSSPQVKVILDHLNLVKEVDKNNSKTNEFCAWLRGVMETYQRTPTDTEREGNFSQNSENVTELVRVKLNEMFEHVIDKSYEDPEGKDSQEEFQNKLNKVHGHKNIPLRC